VGKYIALSIILLSVACLMAACDTETITPLMPQEAPLMPPQHVLTARIEGGDILITWEPNSQINLAGYNIYRSVYRADAFTRLNPLPVQEATYLDETAAANTRYEYRIVCVGVDKRESSYGTATIYNGITAGGEREKKIIL
jgi:fibronectin type 3 domain-containing protein